MKLCLTDSKKQNEFNAVVDKLNKVISTLTMFKNDGDDKFFVEFKPDYLSITDTEYNDKKNIMRLFLVVH